LERVTIVFNDVSALRVSDRFSRRAAWCARTFAGRAADLARQDGVLLACAAVEQVSAVRAKDE
jgi:hypothetical protein